jgi:DNA-binding NtrC family response regulator
MQPRVLVLDDDANILSAFSDFFKKEQCIMIAASSAEEAMKKLEEVKVDLLITDIRLKGRSGVTFFLNAKILYPLLSTIIMTGYPESVDEQEILSLGADCFLVKPLDLEKLRKAVRICLSDK